MSKISLASNASGTGIFTLSSPATNTNRTLTLPDSTGTLLDTNGGTITGTLTVTGVTTLGNGAVLGVPTSGTITNLTGLPLTTGVTGTLPVANGGTGITSFGSGIATFLGTPSSANLASAVTDETGSGALVFGTSPTLTTPTIAGATLSGTIAGGGNNINNVIIGASNPLAGAFTTLSATKATAGDVITFTNAAASNKTGFLYSDSSFIGFMSGAGLTGSGIYLNAATNNSLVVALGSATIGNFSAAGLAVTGTLSATGDVTVSNGKYYVVNTYGYYFGGASNLTGFTGSNGTGTITVNAYGSSVASFTQSGLAVTGTLSSTLGATIQGLTVGLGSGGVGSNTAVGVTALSVNASGSGNTALGYQALKITTASDNTALSAYALQANISGSSNVAVGSLAMITNVSGSYNTAVGAGVNGSLQGALGLNSSGSNNTAIGYAALRGNDTASNNTAVGYRAAYTNTTGTSNVAVGPEALFQNIGGSYNTAVGAGVVGTVAAALGNNNSGTYNTGIGNGALSENTTASFNTAVGAGALQKSISASNNTAVGYQAGYTNQTAGYNTFLGNQAGYTYNTTGDTDNTFVGSTAGYGATIGTSNSYFGAGSGNAVTSGSKNTIIGKYSGNQDSLDIRILSNYVVLSDGDGNRQITMKEGQTLALDSAVPNAGTGITFPASQSASSNANTLDDYEEGTWTPVIQGGTTAGTYTYEAARTGGKYTKVGNMVTVWGVVRIDSITTAGTGSLRIGGLPFDGGSRLAPSWTNSDSFMVNLYAAGVNASAATYPPPLMGSLNDGVSSFDIISYGKNYAVGTVIGDLSGNSWIYQISGSYTTT